MGVLERWDERNQAWADRQNAKPYPPPRSRLWQALNILVFIGVSVRFIAALATGAWLDAILFGLLALIGMYIFGYVAWAWARRRQSA